jgi:hypothetical protein
MRKLSLLILIVLTAFGSTRTAHATTPPAGVNLLNNSSFNLMFNSWSNTGMTWDVVGGVLELNNHTGSIQAIFQTIPSYTASAGHIYDLRLLIGNRSSVSKNILVTIDNGTGSSIIQCAFAVPANMPLEHYRVRGVVGTTWSSLRVLIRLITFNDTQPALLVDDVYLYYTPGAGVTSTLCSAPPAPTPAPTPTPEYFFRQVVLSDEEPMGYQLSYSVTAGEAMIAVIVFGLFVVGILNFVLKLRGG